MTYEGHWHPVCQADKAVNLPQWRGRHHEDKSSSPKAILLDVRKPKECNHCSCGDRCCNSGALPHPFQVLLLLEREKGAAGGLAGQQEGLEETAHTMGRGASRRKETNGRDYSPG